MAKSLKPPHDHDPNHSAPPRTCPFLNPESQRKPREGSTAFAPLPSFQFEKETKPPLQSLGQRCGGEGTHPFSEHGDLYGAGGRAARG
jgi:hypothetical protein